MDRERLCSVVERESMIDLPLLFMRRARPLADCDPARAVKTRYGAPGTGELPVVAEIVPLR